MTIFKDKQFRKALVYHPKTVSSIDIQNKLISGFLNKWGARFPNNSKSASAILKTIRRLSPYLQALDKYKIESVNFNKVITTHSGDYGTISECITYVFNKLSNCYGDRPTFAAKTLGILNPKLFVMWDQTIAARYSFDYVEFLKDMQNSAQMVKLDSCTIFGIGDPAKFLSKELGISPQVPLAKFIDEYNWCSITKAIKLPPTWHPCNDRRQKPR